MWSAFYSPQTHPIFLSKLHPVCSPTRKFVPTNASSETNSYIMPLGSVSRKVMGQTTSFSRQQHYTQPTNYLDDDMNPQALELCSCDVTRKTFKNSRSIREKNSEGIGLRLFMSTWLLQGDPGWHIDFEKSGVKTKKNHISLYYKDRKSCDSVSRGTSRDEQLKSYFQHRNDNLSMVTLNTETQGQRVK